MEITSVKRFDTQLLVNDYLVVPDDMSNLERQEIAIWESNGGIIAPEFTDEELLEKAKNEKIQVIKDLRDYEDSLPTPKNGSGITYQIEGADVTFKLSLTELNLVSSIIDYLERKASEEEPIPTRSWGDINGNRHQLNAEQFRKLFNHLLARDEQQFDLYRKRKDAIIAIASLDRLESEEITIEEIIEQVNSFDITQVFE